MDGVARVELKKESVVLHFSSREERDAFLKKAGE